jgi:nicotinamide-nucleotide amidase
VARVLGLTLDTDEGIVEALRERFARRGMVMPENNRRQAQVPRGAQVIDNRYGSAPGLWIDAGKTSLVLLPGPPREMTPMLEGIIRERLAPKASGLRLLRRVLRITGRAESDVDSCAQPVYGRWLSQEIPIATTILASMGQIELHLTACSTDAAAAGAALESAVGELQEALGACVYSVDGRPLEEVVGGMLRSAGWTIAAAESCTGGLLLSRLTDVPGSSTYVERGVVCYSNAAKTELLGVPAALIAEHGAVSEPVARAMAESIRTSARADVGVGITGIAGPGGGTPEKPVGTVAIAVITPAGPKVRTLHLLGGREMVKFQATQAALNMVRLAMGAEMPASDAALRSDRAV